MESMRWNKRVPPTRLESRQQNGRVPIYRYSPTDIEPLVSTTLVAERIRERDDLQRLLMKRIDIISKDLLVIAEEYSLFQDSRRRIDILAIDRGGSLVVIELKRTEDGGHMELQALRYAAMVSTITLDHLVETFADAQSTPVEDARESIRNWLDEPIDELPNHVKIILVSANFSTEVTGTVLWLNENYNLDISCIRIVPYRLNAEILLDLQQIIPLPEAKDFQIQQRQKGAAAAAERSSGRDFTRYDLTIDSQVFADLSKQAAVKLAVQMLHAAGVSIPQIQSVTDAARWLPVHPLQEESPMDAFVREYPDKSPKHRWFDLGVSDDEAVWVMPRLGGTNTEFLFGALASVALPRSTLAWSRVESDPAVGSRDSN